MPSGESSMLNKSGIWQLAAIALLALLTYTESFAQNSRIDSLTKLLGQATGKDLIDVTNRLAFETYMYDNEKSHRFSREAASMAANIGYKKGVAEASIYQGIYYYLKGENDTGRGLLKKGESAAITARENGLRGYALIQLGNLNRNLGQNDSAYYYYQKSYEVLKDSLNPWYLGSLYGNISKYYNVTSRPKQEYAYLEKALKIRAKLHDTTPLVDVLLLLSAWHQEAFEFEKAGDYLARAEALVSNETPEELKINVKTRKASLLTHQGKQKEAIQLFDEINKFYVRNASQLQVVISLTNTGLIFEQTGDFESSQRLYYKALQLAEANRYPLESVRLYIRIAWVHFELGNIPLANEFIDKAIGESTRYQYLVEQGDVYNLRGVLNKENGSLKVSEESLRKSLEIRNQLGYPEAIAEVLKNLGDVMERKGDLRASLSLHTRSLAIDEQIQNRSGIAWSYYFLGRVYKRQSNFQRAKDYLEKAEEQAKTLKLPVLIKMVYSSKRELMEAQGRFKEALKYAMLFQKVQDSVFNQALKNRVSNLQYTYQLEQKEKDIANRQEFHAKELAIQKNVVRQQFLIIFIILLALLSVGFLAWTMFRKNQKIRLLNFEIQARNEEILAQSEEILAANNAFTLVNEDLENKQRAITFKNKELLQANEEIRAQRDQLDSQNIELERIRSIVEKQNDDIKAQNQNLEDEVKKRTQELVQYSSQLEQFAFIASHNLRGPVARILGLGELLNLKGKSQEDEDIIKKNLIASTRDLDMVVKDLSTILNIKENRSLPIIDVNIKEIISEVMTILKHEIIESNASIETHFSGSLIVRSCRPYLTSVFSNLLSNAIKYRHPNRQPEVSVKVCDDQDYCRIEISDNGVGIDLNLYKDKIFSLYKRFHNHVDGKGLGLYLIKTQVIALGGRIEVDSEVEVGSTFKVWLRKDG